MTPVIRTERLLLREWREADKLPYSLLNGDAEQLQMLLGIWTERDALGVGFRPHVKTSKCTPVALAQLAAGARGIVNAGVGQGDVTPDVLAGLDDARRAGVHVVRASRVPGGTVIANGAIRDDEHDFVAADTLNPQKARVLLMLALTATDGRREIQRIFDQY